MMEAQDLISGLGKGRMTCDISVGVEKSGGQIESRTPSG